MSARVEEIRTENHLGDVSSEDIEWLCCVVDAVETYLAHYDSDSRDFRHYVLRKLRAAVEDGE